MNPDWKAFLQGNGAEFISSSDENSEEEPSENYQTEHLVSFKNTEGIDYESQISIQDVLLCNSSERGLIKVSGDDAETFLQNQLTNDIRNVTESNHQASAWCSPKGRIIANFQIFKKQGDFYLALSADLIPHVLKKLRMYVMMSKVTIEDITDSMIHFTFAGKNVDKLMSDFLDITLNKDENVIHHETITLLHSSLSDSDVARFDTFVDDLEQAKSLWNQCREVAIPVSGSGTKYLNITAGKPEISVASTEAWIPQMVNYIQVDGVDFKKGCYPGQEVVARLNYLGKTKRRMYRVEIETDQLPEVGASIKSEKDAQAGKVLNAVLKADGNVEALAILKIADATNPLTLAANDAIISMLDLPYGVDDE